MKKSKRLKKSNTWKIKQHRDPFFKKSKVLGYRSRASFKLIELNEKFKFIKKNTSLLDLGSSPGGWSQVASKTIVSGKILSIDIKAMDPVENVKFFKCDILDNNTENKIINFFKGNLDANLGNPRFQMGNSSGLGYFAVYNKAVTKAEADVLYANAPAPYDGS